MNKLTEFAVHHAAAWQWPALGLALGLMTMPVMAAMSAAHSSRLAEATAAVPPELKTVISQSLRSIEPVGAGHHGALNPENRLALDFDGQGLAVAPGGKVPGWHWRLQLTGYGTPGHLQPVAPAEAVAAKQRLEYRRGAVTEWYENRPEGLEQGFTLARPPVAGAASIELRLSASGDLKAEIEKGGHGAKLRDKQGQAVLAYRDLSVADAKGKPLPAHLTLAGGQLSIAVDVRGAAWPIVVDPLIATEQAKLTASDAAANDRFGQSVGIAGDTAVVGASGVNSGAGAAYVYERSGGVWTQQAKLTASDAATGDFLGASVGIAGDTVVAGALGVNSGVGAAYVYERSGGVWTQQAKLTASDGAAPDYFGASVGIAGDTVVAGAQGANGNEGAAYVYVKPVGGWADATQTAKLSASDAVAGDRFGASVGIAGATVVAGAQGANGNEGAAYVYVKPSGSWADATETAKLSA
ncbi:MAG: FG-GAP repeat protein, partial [Methylococcus sp.]|nr:FG-GAP repeat protein [Methylococcus sp.]